MSDSKGTGLAVLGGALIAVAVLAAYHGTFSAPFVFDAASIMANNPTIRHLGSAFFPPHDGSTVDGRPLVNLSLALNYAISGPRVWSYHALNLGIHVLAAWLLYGIVRRTVPGGPARAGAAAFAIALLWAVHPLQTESVTYIAQRAETLAGLCYLLTLYGFIRGAREGRPSWLGLSFLACLVGTTAKEVIVSAPVLVLLYDRTFVAGTFRAAWERRRRYYLALAATWILLAALVLGSAGRHGTAGFAAGIPWLDYLKIQAYAVPHYLRLALWPSPLVFDYGPLQGPGRWFLAAIPIVLLLGGTVAGIGARGLEGRAAGFLGAWFFALLAPTALIPVATQTIAEHRMYLPLAAVIAAVVLAISRALARPAVLAIAAAFVALGLATATAARNEAYGSELTLWSDTVAKRPANDRAHNNLGNALFAAGRIPEALEQYEQALRLRPQDNAEVQYNLGVVLARQGRWPEAIAHATEAVRLAPENPDAQASLGTALANSGRMGEALGQFQVAARLNPGSAALHNDLGSAWFFLGHRAEAAAEYREALRLDPGYADARTALDHLADPSAAKP
jgi:tetratricopeptide (TPR) repeat protein